MTNIYTSIGKLLVTVVITAGIAGCGTAAKEKTAPCKRPANMTSFVADPRQECGSMMSVNGDPFAAFAAIDTLATK